MHKYLKGIHKRLKGLFNRFQEAFNALLAIKSDKLHQYVTVIPSPQNAVNIFQEEWISRFPGPFNELQAGEAALFEDDRIEWALKEIGGIQGKKILELGPLEGGHAYMLQKHGAGSVTSIEANPRAFLRCLIVKQILKLDRVDFLCGDFMEYLRHQLESFDLCVASGVLYHMCHPVEMIALAAQRSAQLFLWTHYYDQEICRQNLLLRPRFSSNHQANYQGFTYTQHRYHYKSARAWNTFCGGPASYSHWLSKEDILACCRYFGFHTIKISHDTPLHPHGPSFALLASKTMIES